MAIAVEESPLPLDPEVAVRARELQHALAKILGIHLSDLEAFLVASAMRP